MPAWYVHLLSYLLNISFYFKGRDMIHIFVSKKSFSKKQPKICWVLYHVDRHDSSKLTCWVWRSVLQRNLVTHTPLSVWGGGWGEPPRRVTRISECPCTENGVCVEASMGLRGWRSCMCNSRVTTPWLRSSGGRSGLQWVAPSAWHNVGADDAGINDLFRSSLPLGWGW
jgi:hypothetical protein